MCSQAPRSDQPAAGFFEGVVVTLAFGPGVFGAVLFAQRVQDCVQCGGGLGGEVAAQHSGAAQGGGQFQVPVTEPAVIVIIVVRHGGALADLFGQLRQVR